MFMTSHFLSFWGFILHYCSCPGSKV